MANQKPDSLHWLVTRQRFHITDPRPPIKSRDEREIGDILSDILKLEPSTKQLPNAVLERWPLIAGKQIAEHTTPSGIRNGVLTIHADHPGWLAEIKRLPKDRLLKKMQSVQGIPDITDLRFQLDPSIRTWNKRT
jgi:predicted nucleic acid-binding Zn ribbon protein